MRTSAHRLEPHRAAHMSAQTCNHALSALNVHTPAWAVGVAVQDAISALHRAVIRRSDACVKTLLARTDLDCNTKDKVSVCSVYA